MATYAIGDIQGCFDELQALLQHLEYDETVDHLWLVGDLVNRGPKSLEVLRWAAGQGNRLTCVLGNHDLHLLARAAGVGKTRGADTLDAVLAAPDRDALVEWLRCRPLLHRQSSRVLVHAGLFPLWDVDTAATMAHETETVLRGPQCWEFLGEWRHPERKGWGKVWRPDLDARERFAFALNALTRLRVCDNNGQMDLSFTDHPAKAPHSLRPWYDLARWPEGQTVIFGHWAALRGIERPGVLGLDTGCIWGGPMTAVRLEDGQHFQQPSLR